MIDPKPVTLERDGIRLEPLSPEHSDGLVAAASDGKLWELWFTSVPEPGAVPTYIRDAVKGQADGHMLPWAVRDLATNTIVGSTRYHDIVPAIDRVEIGYTWYARAASAPTSTRPASCCCSSMPSTRSAARWSACEPTTSTSDRRRRSKALGAKKDGVLRHHQARTRRHGPRLGDVQHPEGRVADVRRHLELRLRRHR